jgi:hypothetical protein
MIEEVETPEAAVTIEAAEILEEVGMIEEEVVIVGNLAEEELTEATVNAAMAQVDSIPKPATDVAPQLMAQSQSVTAPIDHLAIELKMAIEEDRKELGPRMETVRSSLKPNGKEIRIVHSSRDQSGRRTMALKEHLSVNGKRTERNLPALEEIGIKALNALLSQVLTLRRVEISRLTEKKVRVHSKRILKRAEIDLTKRMAIVRSKRMVKALSKRISKRVETDLIKRMVKALSRRTSKKETISLLTRKTENVLHLERIQMHLVALELKGLEKASSNPLLKKKKLVEVDSKTNF